MISIITAAYNAEKYIAETIESVLSQTFIDWEYIIVDDGSTDQTREVIEKYLFDKRLKYYYQPNMGVASARNTAIDLSKGKYIAIIDSDDIWYPDRLQRQYNFIKNNLKCIAVGANADIIDKEGSYLYTSNQKTEWEEIKTFLPKTPFFTSSIIFRRKSVKELRFNQYMPPSEDTLFVNQLAQKGELWNLVETLIKYRVVPSSISNIPKKHKILIKEIMIRTAPSNILQESDRIVMQIISKNKKSPHWKLSNYYSRIGGIYLLKRSRLRKKAIINFLKAILNYPLNFRAWFFLGLSLQPNDIITMWKKFRKIR